MMKKQITITSLLVIILLLPLSTTMAQTGGDFDLSWSTTENGGVSVSSIDIGSGREEPRFILTGVVGQADAGLSTGGSFSLSGGFLANDARNDNNIAYLYLPIIMKSGD